MDTKNIIIEILPATHYGNGEEMAPDSVARKYAGAKLPATFDGAAYYVTLPDGNRAYFGPIEEGKAFRFVEEGQPSAVTLEAIAEALGKKVWEKGDLKRIYLNDVGYNTKNVKSTAYIYMQEGAVKFYAKVVCDGQGPAWEESQENRMVEIMRERCTDAGIDLTAPAPETTGTPAPESPVVKGYYFQWKEVKVPINRFGKLAYRNRKFIMTYAGPQATAPSSFVELNDDQFAKALKMEQAGVNFGYAETPSF